MISIIVAADENNVIGKDNDLIWHLPDDLKYFKNLTTGHTIIMGRRTYESIGRPLPNRTTIIITRDVSFKAEGCIIVHSLEDALKNTSDKDESFIVGGEQIYKLGLPFTDRVYLTRVHHAFDGDRAFPELDSNWKEVAQQKHETDEKHAYPFTFITYEKS